MAGLIGSIIGSGEQGSADDQAKATQAAALAALQNINVPTIGEQELNLDKEKSAGQLSPQQEATISLQGNDLKNITTDPRLLNAQMQALQALQQQGQSGMTATDRAQLAQTENQLTQQANSANQGVLQQAAQRGQAGQGATLAAELANNQNSAAIANQRALQTAGQAQQNALQATAASGNLGQNMQQEQYGEAANAARAQNSINQFNAQNSQNVTGTNTQAANQAQAYNLGNNQNISNTNTGIANQQQQYNKGLYQQQFTDSLNKDKAAAGEADNSAANQMTAGANANKNTQAIAGGAGNALGSIAGMFYNGGVVRNYDEGGSVDPSSYTPASGSSLMANLMAANQVPSTAKSSPTADPGLMSKIGGLLSGTPATTASASANSNPIGNLLAKLKSSNAGNSQQYGLTPQATEDNNYGTPKLQLPPMTGAPSANPTLQMSQQDPNIPHLAKGGIPRPPQPGNQMSMFRMLSSGGTSDGETLGTKIGFPGSPKPGSSPAPKNFKEGGTVPGRATVKGDSPKNDIIPAMLSPNELVIPRTIVCQPDKVIMDFIHAAKKHAKVGK